MATQRNSRQSLPTLLSPPPEYIIQPPPGGRASKVYYPRCNAEEVKAGTRPGSRNRCVRNPVRRGAQPASPSPRILRAGRSAGQGAGRGPRPEWIRVYALGGGSGGRLGYRGQGPGIAEPSARGGLRCGVQEPRRGPGAPGCGSPTSAADAVGAQLPCANPRRDGARAAPELELPAEGGEALRFSLTLFFNPFLKGES